MPGNIVAKAIKKVVTRKLLCSKAEKLAVAYQLGSTMVAPKPSTSFDTLKRENLFRNPPKDKSAFPALLAAVQPHIDSFNAVTAEGGLLDLARQDIGVKSVFDGRNEKGNLGNKLSRMHFLP